MKSHQNLVIIGNQDEIYIIIMERSKFSYKVDLECYNK